MTNFRYQKGVRKERALVNEARELGHIAFRSAGSHSPIDVCIINHIEKEVYLIQSKSDSMSESAKKRLEEKYKFLNGENYKVKFEVV